jgi:hypothetical protein
MLGTRKSVSVLIFRLLGRIFKDEAELRSTHIFQPKILVQQPKIQFQYVPIELAIFAAINSQLKHCFQQKT